MQDESCYTYKDRFPDCNTEIADKAGSQNGQYMVIRKKNFLRKEVYHLEWNPQISPINVLKISGFVPHTGVTAAGILFSAVVPEGRRAFLLLYEKGSPEVRATIPFPEDQNLGRVRAMIVSGIPASELEYNFMIGNEIVTDPAAQLVVGLEKFADPGRRACRMAAERGEEGKVTAHQIRGAFIDGSFDWGEKETFLKIPYSRSVFYELHVRGFTKSKTSKVRCKGTYLGLTEKIPYLKELGVTALVLMPAYEFDEVAKDDEDPRAGWRPEKLRELPDGDAQVQDGTVRLNYWGYGKGWFFAPKSSYSYSKQAADEYREMVRELHRSGIEVIMEMNFPEGTDPAFMQTCLLWWRQIYHVDGFMLIGSQEDINSVSKSPALCDVKLISDYYDTKRMYPKGREGSFRNLAEYNAGFRNDARKFLKGDPDSLHAFLSRSRYNPEDSGVINAVTGHDGFTLLDLVSYNDKHNEANGEENHDGALSEYSWNCGVEGPTRKREICRLRMRQEKNALAMILLSQGTPMITAGDEMGNSQEGNSNPYCFDSELTWVTWQNTRSSRELTEYVRSLITFRRTHPILHGEKTLTGSSDGGTFPDFSIHGSNAWFASFDQQDRSAGLMFCGKASGAKNPQGRVKEERKPDEAYVYIAYNFHWEKRELALPYLPKGRQWHIMIDTSADRFLKEARPVEETGEREEAEVKTVTVPGRTVYVLTG